MIKVAIYGFTATGKSATCRELEKLLNNNLKIRHCGQIVKEKAKYLNYQLDQIPKDLHEAIDSETRTFAATNPAVIVEGRFLHYVLSGFNDFIFIQLSAGIEERATRVSRKDIKTIEDARIAVAQADRDDETLIEALYQNCQPISKPHFVCDTSKLSIADTAELILKTIRKQYDKTR